MEDADELRGELLSKLPRVRCSFQSCCGEAELWPDRLRVAARRSFAAAESFADVAEGDALPAQGRHFVYGLLSNAATPMRAGLVRVAWPRFATLHRALRGSTSVVAGTLTGLGTVVVRSCRVHRHDFPPRAPRRFAAGAQRLLALYAKST